MPLINTTLELKTALRNGSYAWPGGYPLFFICDDGGTLCPVCTRNEAPIVMRAIVDKRRHGRGAYQADWCVIGVDVNWEDDSLTCDNCHQFIESAYGEN